MSGDPRETTGLLGARWTAGNRLELTRPNGRRELRPHFGVADFVVGAVGPVGTSAEHPAPRQEQQTLHATVGGARGRERRGSTRSHPEPGRDPRQRRRVLHGKLCGRRGRRGHRPPPHDDDLVCRGVEQWQLVGLITQRSEVRILPPLPRLILRFKKHSLERIS